MKYNRFEELPVWQAAQELAHRIHDVTESAAFRGHGSLRDQLERAVISISNNVAEGFERGSTKELLNFLYIARGSAGEVRSMLCFMEQRPAFQDLKSQMSNLKLKAENVSRQLRGWADSLQNTKIKGQKYLSEKEAAMYKRRKDRDDYIRELKESNTLASHEGKAGQ